jgi:hypothetical protein
MFDLLRNYKYDHIHLHLHRLICFRFGRVTDLILIRSDNSHVTTFETLSVYIDTIHFTRDVPEINSAGATFDRRQIRDESYRNRFTTRIGLHSSPIHTPISNAYLMRITTRYPSCLLHNMLIYRAVGARICHFRAHTSVFSIHNM